MEEEGDEKADRTWVGQKGEKIRVFPALFAVAEALDLDQFGKLPLTSCCLLGGSLWSSGGVEARSLYSLTSKRKKSSRKKYELKNQCGSWEMKMGAKGENKKNSKVWDPFNRLKCW